MEKLLITKQVAEIFGVDKRTVLYSLISQGLKYVKIGREYRFKQSDIEEFIKNRTYQKEQNIFIDTRTDYQKRMNKKLRVV